MTDKSKITDTFVNAKNATVPLQPPSDVGSAAVGDDRGETLLRRDFRDAYISRDPTAEELAKGRTMMDGILFGPGQSTSMMREFGILIELIKALFGGEGHSLLNPNFEDFTMLKTAFYPEKTFTDPNDLVARAKRLDTVIREKDHPDRKMLESDPSKFIDEHFGGKDNAREVQDSLVERQDILNLLKSTDAVHKYLPEVLGTIEHYESHGRENVVWDYRNRSEPENGPWTGLNPGDTTPEGLVVPEFNKMTVNQVIEWQRQYLEEQYAVRTDTGQYAIPRGSGSSAVTGLQWTKTTLAHLRDSDQNDIDGDTIFDKETQLTLALERLIETRDLVGYIAGDISTEKFFYNSGLEWEALQKFDEPTKADFMAKLERMRDSIQRDLNPAPVTTIASAPSDGSVSPS